MRHLEADIALRKSRSIESILEVFHIHHLQSIEDLICREMCSGLIQLCFQQTIYEQRCVAGNEVTNDMIALTDICRARIEIGFQDTETILYLIAVGADIEDFDCIFVFIAVQVCGNGIVAIILLFVFNNRSINDISVRRFFRWKFV